MLECLIFYFFLLISILIQCYVCVKKVNITQQIEWGLENPEQPIREAGKFEILRVISRVNFYWSETGSESKRKKKSGLIKKLKVSALDI